MTRSNPRWGGARSNSGPIKRNIQLSPDTARTLRVMLEYFRLEYPTTAFTADSLVEAFILQAAERLRETEDRREEQHTADLAR